MKKSLIALATASAVAFGGAGVAVAQDGDTDTQTPAATNTDTATGSTIDEFFGWTEGYTPEGKDAKPVAATTGIGKINSVGDFLKALSDIAANIVTLVKNFVDLGKAVPMPKLPF